MLKSPQLFCLIHSSYYIRYTQDLIARLNKHNNAKTGYTATKKPWEIVYTESFQSKTEALAREKYIKSQKSKSYIQKLIESVAG